jgi:hypothetical protein
VANELTYELRSDSVLYTLGDSISALIKRKSPSRVQVELWRKDALVPPESGDLGTSAFRSKLVDLARKRFGEVNGLAEELGLIAAAFDGHIKEREDAAAEDDRQTNAPELLGTPYRIVDGGIFRLKNTREGEIPQRLTNFTARVEEEVVRDDGAETRRVYKVTGESDGRPLLRTEVPATRFGRMEWISDAWGLSARITAEQGAKDYTREAVELLSQDAVTRHLYAHTGWRELPSGERVYLHAGGAIGVEDVEVELEPGLERYALPASPECSGELAEAVKRSLAFLEVAPYRITAPLLGAAYLAPLSEIIVPDFTLWLYGPTGALKSTLAALVLSHFGHFSETNLPLSFESTSNALERSLFLLKDTLAVVDDWRPGVSRSDASELDKRAQRLLRGVGNRQGRGRMTPNTTLRCSYAPRGVVIATAEALPEGPAFESAAARVVSLNLSPKEVDIGRLSELQRQKGELAKAMSGYVAWVGGRYGELEERLPAFRNEIRETVREKLPNSHPRAPDAAAALVAALETLRDFCVATGVLDVAKAEEMHARATGGVIEAARLHAEATSGGDPATRFTELLRSLFAADRAYVRDRETGEQPPDWRELGGWEETDDTSELCRPARGAEFVGWADEGHLYLDRDNAYAAVASFAAHGGIPFGIKQRALWGSLKQAGLNLADQGRNDTTAWVCGKSKRVVQIARRAVFEGEGDE